MRDEGVFILGSGLSFHDLRALRSGGAQEPAERFDAWLSEAVMNARISAHHFGG